MDDKSIKKTGRVIRDFRGKIIAEENEGLNKKSKNNWIYKSTPGSELEYMQGCTIIAL